MLYSCQKITVKTVCVKLHYIVVKDRKFSKLIVKKNSRQSGDAVQLPEDNMKTACVKLDYIVVKDRKFSKLLSKKFGTLNAVDVNTNFAMLHTLSSGLSSGNKKFTNSSLKKIRDSLGMLYSCQKITVKTACVKLHYIVVKDRKLSKLLSKKFGTTLNAVDVNTIFAMLHHIVIRKQKILKLNVKKIRHSLRILYSCQKITVKTNCVKLHYIVIKDCYPALENQPECLINEAISLTSLLTRIGEPNNLDVHLARDGY